MRLILIITFLICFAPSSFAQTVGEVTKLPIPRFVSMKGDLIYARTGPGTRYPIKWVYQRKYLPIEVVQEFDTWRKVRDSDGEEGWVHESLLGNNRYGIVTDKQAVPLLKKPIGTSNAVALVETGAQLHLDECQKDGWCKASASGFRGWIHADSLWGVYEGEQIE